MKNLFLDDCRECPPGWELAKDYHEFVESVNREMPDVISFDHDLGLEHYSMTTSYYFEEEGGGGEIPYDSYEEKTGYDCAKYLLEIKKFPKLAIIHSFNLVGSQNIANALQGYTKTMIRPYHASDYFLPH